MSIVGVESTSVTLDTKHTDGKVLGLPLNQRVDHLLFLLGLGGNGSRERRGLLLDNLLQSKRDQKVSE